MFQLATALPQKMAQQSIDQSFNWETILTATVVAAIISAVVSLLGHWISSKNAKLAAQISEKNARLAADLNAKVKLADFRQAWIDALRKDMAELYSIGVTPDTEHQNTEKFYDLVARIQLRMNPDDEQYGELEKCLYTLMSTLSEEKWGANPEFVKVCQIILKKEWDTLKNDVKSVTVP